MLFIGLCLFQEISVLVDCKKLLFKFFSFAFILGLSRLLYTTHRHTVTQTHRHAHRDTQAPGFISLKDLDE